MGPSLGFRGLKVSDLMLGNARGVQRAENPLIKEYTLNYKEIIL